MPSRHHLLTSACLLLLAFWPVRGESTDPVQPAASTPIVRVLELPIGSQKSDGVKIRGVVTMWQPDQAVGVIQDETAGVWVACWKEKARDHVRGVIRPGLEVVIEGRVSRGGYSPLILIEAIEFMRELDLPLAPPADLERLFIGTDNALRVTCTGIVQGYRREDNRKVDLVIACGARHLQAQVIDGEGLPGADALVDARVQLIGVVGAIRNTRGEFIAPRLVTPRAADVTIVEPPPATPADVPLVELVDIGRYRFRPQTAHRIITEGVVTYATRDSVFIQRGLCGVQVVPASPPSLAPGDRVRVTGFVDTSRRIAGLCEAAIERLEGGPAPEPIAIAPADIVRINTEAVSRHLMADPSDYNGCLIKFPATVAETRPADSDGAAGELVLTSGGITAVAALPGDSFAMLAGLRPGTRVQATGVVQIHLSPGVMAASETVVPVLRQVTLLLRTPTDVVVLSAPSWWTPRRLAAVLATLATVLSGALVWVWLLRREVQSQGRMLAREMRLRRDAAIEYEASLRERNRLAANLHDTLLQTVGGIVYQLGACRTVSSAGSGMAAQHLEVAGKMVEHATKELRGSVWALRTVPLVGQSFTDSMQTLLNQLSMGRTEHLSLTTIGTSFPIPNFVAGNLLLVAQEAIYNALQHSHCTEVATTVTFHEERGEIAATISDNGQGFVVGEEVGPQQGHFGLQGMRERIERLGGTFEITSLRGEGTAVRARVLTRDYDAHLEGEGR
ncbi:MAG: histidine kinase [Pirellulales bacterium]